MCGGTNSIESNNKIYTALFLDVGTQDVQSALFNAITRTYCQPDIPKYIISSSKLYLLSQVTWNNTFAMQVRKEKWHADQIQALISQNNNALKKYFPDPNKPMGGICWLEEKK